jgi:hypothetical protein
MRGEWNLSRVLAVAALSAIASSAFAGEITLYQNRDFRGDSLTLRRPAPNLEQTGFNDSASSVVVREGVWEVCSDPFYGGTCTRLGPGQYDRLERTLNDRVASAREVSNVSVAPAPAPSVASAPAPIVSAMPAPVVSATPAPVVSAAVPRATLYAQPGFAGTGVEITETHGNLDAIPSYAGASAVIVYGGTWRLCTREYYRGQCADFTPGRYDSLGALNGRVYSAQLISAAPAPVGVVTPMPSAQGRVVLYELPDFAGQSLAIEGGEMSNLDRLNFGDRAASMRIDGGYWMFCTDTRFRGSCSTYGPGEYPRLGPDVDHKIASIRRVNDVYGALSAQ